MQNSGDYKPATHCAEFHEQLPYLMDVGHDVEQEPHLRTCENCRALVTDLRYIADQAKLLLPMHDPSPRVWNNIQSTLEKEGLAKEGRLRGPAQTIGFPQRSNNTTIMAWAGSIAAAVALVIGIAQMRQSQSSTAPAPNSVASDFDADDSQLLAQLEQQSPQMREVYAKGLRDVNQAIAEAKKLAAQDPDEGGEYLRAAMEQKAMLYEMATSRSLN
jgi:hypothetical protein